MDDLSMMQRIAVWALPVLFAITVHEVAHGWIAMRLGDKTAMMLGRLTLNPIKHIDPVGSILVPITLLLFTGFIMGWAKPVPITWENLKNPKRDMALVALGGPLANLIMALLWAFVMKLGYLFTSSITWIAQPLIYMGGAGVFINVVLMVLNLLPLPPLDGSRVITSVLPDKIAWKYNRIENYGIFILIFLFAIGVLGQIIGPPIFGLQNLIFHLMGL
jgi:Zn-dependent protease